MSDSLCANKVVYGGNTLIDLTNDTITPEDLAEGKTAHDASGAPIVGTGGSGGGITPDGIMIDDDGYIILSTGSYTSRFYINSTTSYVKMPAGIYKWAFTMKSSVDKCDFYRAWRNVGWQGDTELHLKFGNPDPVSRFQEIFYQARGSGNIKVYFEGEIPKPTYCTNFCASAVNAVNFYFYGKIDFTNCPSSYAPNLSGRVYHIEIYPNTLSVNGNFKNAYMDEESIIAVANSLKDGAAGTIKMPTSKLPTVIYGETSSTVDINGNTTTIFTKSDGGSTTLASFITNTKGWSYT